MSYACGDVLLACTPKVRDEGHKTRSDLPALWGWEILSIRGMVGGDHLGGSSDHPWKMNGWNLPSRELHNISPPKWHFKDDIPNFPRWDMLVPWRVPIHPWKDRKMIWTKPPWLCFMLIFRGVGLAKYFGSPPSITRWWFQTFFIFTHTWGRFPIWLIFFNWVGSTTY